MPDTTTDTKRCPFCAEDVRAEAIRCKHCGTWLCENPLQHEWFRSRDGRIAGVCAGLGEEFHISVTLIRVLFVLATIFSGGLGLIVYIALWFIMPKRPSRVRE
jgi:phage shock protein PspC (stress-responsive transcriptional regulator)